MIEETAEPAKQKDNTVRTRILTLLKKESFLEKVLLLIVTALISGLVVPLAVTYINAQSSAQQRQIDEARAQQQRENDQLRIRNEEMLQSQGRLLREFSEVVLTYGTLALDVSWFASKHMLNKDRHEKAISKYNDRIVDLWSEWRTVNSQANILASSTIARKMESLIGKAYSLDKDLMGLYSDKNTTLEQWTAQHHSNVVFLQSAEATIQELAKDLKLMSQQSHVSNNN